MFVADDLRLKPRKTYRVEFAFVDRRASLAIDGREVITPLDLPFDPPARPARGGMSRPFQLGASNASVIVRNLRLTHDIHYLSVGKADRGWPLAADEYFLLGDNSSNSHDSRYWAINDRPSPGVPEAAFIGKPFLIHQPLRLGRLSINGTERTFRTLDWARVRWLR
jgi:signal peptidase I